MKAENTNHHYGVRTIYYSQVAGCYKERITIWAAGTWERAVELAESDASNYAIDDFSYAGLAQSYSLLDDVDPPASSTEVFSLIRWSELEPEAYINKFFRTGAEIDACGDAPLSPREITHRSVEPGESDNEARWYAVRTLYHWRSRKAYEERVTIWAETSCRLAIERAEEEARAYGVDAEDIAYINLAQAHQIPDVDWPLSDSAELFSLTRRSDLDVQEYLDEFFDTGMENANKHIEE